MRESKRRRLYRKRRLRRRRRNRHKPWRLTNTTMMIRLTRSTSKLMMMRSYVMRFLGCQILKLQVVLWYFCEAVGQSQALRKFSLGSCPRAPGGSNDRSSSLRFRSSQINLMGSLISKPSLTHISLARWHKNPDIMGQQSLQNFFTTMRLVC